MKTGLLAGLFWGLDTVILGVALTKSGFCSTSQAVALAPFISTFFHDFFSSVWMIIYTSIRGQWKNIIRALKTKSGKFIILGALLGGPVGMSGYVAAINYIGPAYTAIITAIYPAVAALLSRIFLKEKMKAYQFAALGISICGVIALGYTPGGGADVKNLYLGFACAILCVLGWGTESVICAYGMKDEKITNEHALQIRQFTSAFTYAVVIIPLLKGWNLTADLFFTAESSIVLAAAFFGTVSYLFYYKTIARLGASKATALNITYSAWAIVFSVILLKTVPDIKSIICCVVILSASIVAGTDIKKLKGEK